MAPVVAFVTKYWTHLLLAAVVATAILYVTGLQRTIEQQKTTIAELNGNIAELTRINDELQDANEQLTVAITTQNAAIKQTVAEAEAKIATSMAALAAAKAETERLRKRYASILNAPPTSPDVCTATSNLLEQYITMRREEIKQ